MKQAFRIISRMKGYTALSLLGLIISLSGTVIISRYLYQEWTIDHWMPDHDRTFILCQRYVNGILGDEPTPGLAWNPNNTKGFVSPTLGQSDVEAFSDVHLLENGSYIILDNDETITAPTISVDSSFVDVFPLQALEGTLVLRTEGQAIVSDDFARRHFPGESAVGKTMKMGDENILHTIVGVFRRPSGKSTVHFDVANYARRDWWVGNALNFTMIKLAEGASMEAYNERQPKNSWGGQNPEFHFLLVPYTGNLRRLVESYGQEYRTIPSLSPCSSPQYLWMLFVVAVLLFLVGIFNFLNLYAVMRSHRRHELQVRRIFGASRWDIFCQLYAETFLLALLTMIGVWTVVELMEPLLTTYYNIEVLPQRTFDVGLTLFIVFGLPLISSFTPLPTREGHGGESWGAAGFLFLQYFISITLITVSIYMMRQLHLMMDGDPGYRTEGILHIVPKPREDYNRIRKDDNGNIYIVDNSRGEKAMAVLKKLRECPYIQSVIEDPDMINAGELMEIEGHKLVCKEMCHNTMEMFGLTLLEGRELNDTLDGYSYNCLLNETAVRHLGLKDWRSAKVQLPERWWTSANEDCSENPPYNVVGIVKDFHPGRLSEPQPPIIFFPTLNWDSQTMDFLPDDLLLSIASGCEEDAIKYLRQMNKEVWGTEDLEYNWLSDQKDELYREDRRTARIFFTFSLLAIAVTCLGVLGLMMFDVRRRYREIALRKVNGATFLDIALLLSRRYLIILAVAATVSIPVSLIGLHQLITRYYTIHATIAWWIPLVSILIVLLLCALTLWQQVWKATRIKPYEVLKEN
ncbi:MAG: ABC transporter permease [Bacteroidaceae bacterium]|nr:ABC transporter permease [Bacteroidaceae bacterium]